MRRAILLLSDKLHLTFMVNSKVVTMIEANDTKSVAELLYKTEVDRLDVVFKGTISKKMVNNTVKIANFGSYRSLITTTDSDYIGDLSSSLGIKTVNVHDYLSYVLDKYANEKVIAVDIYPNYYGISVINNGKLIDFRKAYDSTIKSTISKLQEYYKCYTVFTNDKIDMNFLKAGIGNFKLIEPKYYEILGYIPYVLSNEGLCVAKNSVYTNVFEEKVEVPSKKTQTVEPKEEPVRMEQPKGEKSGFFGRFPWLRKEKEIIPPKPVKDESSDFGSLDDDIYDRPNILSKIVFILIMCTMIFGIAWTTIYQGKIELVKNDILIMEEQADAIQICLNTEKSPLRVSTDLLTIDEANQITSISGDTKSFIFLYKDKKDGEDLKKKIVDRYNVTGGAKIDTNQLINTFKVVISL